MKNWKIKTKKDWILLFIGTPLLVYSIVNGCFGNRIMGFMERFMPDKLTVMNQPGGYGTMIVTVMIMTILSIGLEIVWKKKTATMWITACSGILLSTAILGGYYFHGWLLVRQVYNTPAVSANVSFGGNNINLQSGDQRLIKLQELAAGMERLPKEEEVRARIEDHGSSGSPDIVWIHFPQRYFHSYDLIFKITADKKIYIGSGERWADYYEDNGLVDYLYTVTKKEKEQMFE